MPIYEENSMHNEISPPGLIMKAKCVRRQGEHFKHGGKILYTLNEWYTNSKLLPLYRNIHDHANIHT